MQLASLPQKKSLVNLTPLIDVVFILLIFFMLASNFIRWHTLELAVSDASAVVVDPLALSIVAIHADAKYELNQQAMSLEEIILSLRNKVSDNTQHPIIVQPLQGASVQQMVDVLNNIKVFAGNNVSIAKPIKEER